MLDIGDEKLMVDFSGEEKSITKKNIPLFKEILYMDSAYDNSMLQTQLNGVPVFAFHSYKGGVGRTLSLLAFAKAWTAKQTPKHKRVLIVDSDIEAPGLTWLQNEETEQHFSFLDLLELIQSKQADKCLESIIEQIKKSTLKISTEKEIVEQYFIPTYRYQEQLLDIYTKPETIVTSTHGKYIIPEILSQIGKLLGTDAVLVDLRAGLSEFSSPFLFDPRVKKYFVSSTSEQSIAGIKVILNQVTKGLPIDQNMLLPEILLTMVPDTLNSQEKDDIVGEILNCFYSRAEEDSSVPENLVTELPFSSELIHLGSLAQIMQILGGTPFYQKIEKMVENNYVAQTPSIHHVNVKNREQVIKNIHNFARKQITAEGNVKIDILVTQAISNLKRKYRNEIPSTIIMGAKGSGKTFLYLQLLRSGSWTSFCASLDKKIEEKEDMLFIPVLAATNSREFVATLESCVQKANDMIKCCDITPFFWNDNETAIKKYIQTKHNSLEWTNFWEKLLVQSINKNFTTFHELAFELDKDQKKIIFLLDGLEEILQDTIKDTSQQDAIYALCQEIVRILDMRYKNIGIILFLRKDLARDAIKVNFEQFNQLYNSVELRWDKSEALKLALWLVNQAHPGFYGEEVPIESATPEIIAKELQKLWGLKLGKASSNEAYSSQWILAALSDFNGQLQARDIIRFLQCATINVGKEVYDDRYLMPTEIKNAVPDCSAKKIEEIKQEIGALKPILEKLGNASIIKKVLPFSESTFDLTPVEERLMIQEGYLKITDGKYYLPEIIRHSLGFKYEKGARPKVLSLLKNI